MKSLISGIIPNFINGIDVKTPDLPGNDYQVDTTFDISYQANVVGIGSTAGVFGKTTLVK